MGKMSVAKFVRTKVGVASAAHDAVRSYCSVSPSKLYAKKACCGFRACRHSRLMLLGGYCKQGKHRRCLSGNYTAMDNVMIRGFHSRLSLTSSRKRQL